jgi:hypothetical protein
MLLEPNEIQGHRIQLRGQVSASLDALKNPVANALRFAVVKRPSQDTTLSLDAPLAYRLINQQVKERVIGGGNRASETRLFRIALFAGR